LQENLPKRRQRGISAERELVRKLWKLGFAVVRGPASGAKIRRSVYPDVVAIKNRHIFVIEVKKRSKLDHIYIDRTQIEKLKEFARRAEGEAVIAIKVAELGSWKIIPLDIIMNNTVEISSEKIRIDKEMIKNAEDLIEYLRKRINIGLDAYISKSSIHIKDGYDDV